MEFDENQRFEKYGKQCMHCTQNILSPHENERTIFECG